MENEKRISDDQKRDSVREDFSVPDFSSFIKKVCPACGTCAARTDAKFCLVCGKSLSEDYQPLDALRSSYRLQRKSFATSNAQAEEIPDLFEQNKNFASETASALVVYSLVPYLGILFCPFALVFGGVGVVALHRQPKLGGGRAPFCSLVLTVIIFAVQMLLWWLLYFVPESGKSI